VCAAQESVSKKYIYSAWRDSWIPLIPYIFGAFAPLIGLLAWKRAQIGGWLLRRPQVTFAVAGSLLIWVIASGVLLHFEWEWNEHFNSLPTAMRFGFLYLTSFPGYAPITPDGQSAVQIAKWISLLLFGGLVGPLLKEGLDTLGKHMSTLSQMEVPKFCHSTTQSRAKRTQGLLPTRMPRILLWSPVPTERIVVLLLKCRGVSKSFASYFLLEPALHR